MNRLLILLSNCLISGRIGHRCLTVVKLVARYGLQICASFKKSGHSLFSSTLKLVEL